MAIYSSVAPPEQQTGSIQQEATPIDVEAWTVSALSSLSISPSARGTGVTLSIPIDDSPEDASAAIKAALKPRRDALQRDSMKRRDALIRGKEGSRRRQRWENGMS